MNARLAKKIRREVKELKYKLASELKGYINSMGLRQRLVLALKIMFRKKW